MEVLLADQAKCWIDAANLSVEEIQETCRNPTQFAGSVQNGKQQFNAVKFFAEDNIVLCLCHADGNLETPKRVTVVFCIRLRKSLPQGQITPEMSVDAIVPVAFISFGWRVEKAMKAFRDSSGYSNPNRYEFTALIRRPRGDTDVVTFDVSISKYSDWMFPKTKVTIGQQIVNDVGVSKVGGYVAQKLKEFHDVIERHANSEEAVHQWFLEDFHHRVFLDAYTVKLHNKLKFGKTVSDFVIELPGNKYKLVEIERPSRRTIKNNEEFHSELHHACDQVSDWQNYIADNIRYCREELKLAGITKPEGMVVIGRASEIKGDEAERRWQRVSERLGHDVVNYDELGLRAEAAMKNLLPHD